MYSVSVFLPKRIEPIWFSPDDMLRYASALRGIAMNCTLTMAFLLPSMPVRLKSKSRVFVYKKSSPRMMRPVVDGAVKSSSWKSRSGNVMINLSSADSASPVDSKEAGSNVSVSVTK